jgi:hypothetical protein
VQAIIVAIDKCVASATGNRDFFLNTQRGGQSEGRHPMIPTLQQRFVSVLEGGPEFPAFAGPDSL